MRIMHVHWGFPPIIGGVETHLACMLPVMAKRKNKLSLITGSVEGVRPEYMYKGVSIYRTPLMDLNWLFKRGLIGLENEIEAYFKKIIDIEKPQIINTHNMHYFSKVHIMILQQLAQAKGIPLILSAHNVWDDLLYIELTKNVKWDQIVAVSHYIKRELMGIGIPEDIITVIHHGVDTKQFHPNISPAPILKRHPILKGKKIIFHPARMGLAKGCDVSIKAMHLIKEKFPYAMLVLAGTKHIIDWGASQQKDIAYMVGLVKAMKLEKNILIDVYSIDEIAQLCVLAEVCVYPSTGSEPFGLTMLEALATARPMVVTNSGGMPEIVQGGINGYVVPVKDFETLALKVMQLLDNKALRNRLGNTGREIVLSHYTKEHMTENYLQLYKKILS